MSSFLCFVCHSTVNADTNEDTREKYREVIGMNLCPDSHLCFICCHFLNKMCLFKSICLKRSLEYPVLFSEKGTINLQKSDTQVAILCPEDICIQHLNSRFHFGNTNDNSQSDSEDKYVQLHREQQNNEMEQYNNDYIINNDIFNDNLPLNDVKNAECGQCISFSDCSHKFGENSHKFSAISHDFGENSHKFRETSCDYGGNEHKFRETSHGFSETGQIFGENSNKYVENGHKHGENSFKYVENGRKSEISHKYGENSHKNGETGHIDASSQTYDITAQIVIRENELFCKIPQMAPIIENTNQINKTIQENETDNLTNARKDDDFYEEDSQISNNSHSSKNSQNDEYSDTENSNNDNESIVNTEIDNEIETTEDFNMDNNTNNSTDITITETKKVNRKVKKKEFKKIVLSIEEQKRELQTNRQSKKYLEAVFKCHSCAMGFLLKESYQAHMMRHEESNGEHRCNICKLRFANPAVLRSHLANHAERYKCRYCQAIVRARQRQTHLVACRGSETEGVTCHLCGNVFLGASHFQQHLKRFHHSKTSSRTLSCNVCGKTYDNQAALRTHMITHINRKFVCDVCNTVFSSPYTLNQHKKTHSAEGSELHYCIACKTSYRTRKSLLAHWRTALAHRETVYKCPTCNRTCPTLSSLHGHISSVHDRTKHLSCDVCPARYSTRKALVRHMVSHKMQGPKQTPLCHACGEYFKSTSKLKRHLRNVCEKDKLEEDICNYYGQ